MKIIVIVTGIIITYLTSTLTLLVIHSESKKTATT